MRVLFSIHELALNGAVTALLQLARHMRGRGDSVTILAPQLTGAPSALEAAFREIGVEIVHQCPMGQHDIAVGCTVFAAGVLEQLVGRMPTAWWIHEGRAGVNSLIGRPAAQQTLSKVGKLIFPSRGVVERLWTPLLSNLPPGRVEVIPYLIPSPSPGEVVERRPGQSRIVCVGSLYPRKRQVDLVRAVSMLKGLSVECVLIGEHVGLDPPAEDLIRSDPDRFVLTGGLQPDAVQAWYRGSDVFCLPSGDECMPIAPVEAAWHGVPVVLADLECYEGVWRHGVNAMIHPVGDAELLAWYLHMLISSESLRSRFGASARAVAPRFSEARGGALFDAALQEAIAAFR